MKCPKSTCGAEGPGQFCHVCGTKKVENFKHDAVIICRGKLENGKPCQSELKLGDNFCMCCGNKVDESLFDLFNKRCINCDSALVPGKPFCAGCGQRQFIQIDSTVPDEYVARDNRSDLKDSLSKTAHPLKENKSQNEGDKGSLTMDSEADFKFDDYETKSIDGAASLCTDNDVGSGTSREKNKKRKKNKKSRKRDRESNKQNDNLLDENLKSKKTETTDNANLESKKDLVKRNLEIKKKDKAESNTVENDGRVFGLAKPWNNSQTPDNAKTLTPTLSNLFKVSSISDTKDDNSNVADDRNSNDEDKGNSNVVEGSNSNDAVEINTTDADISNSNEANGSNSCQTERINSNAVVSHNSNKAEGSNSNDAEGINSNDGEGINNNNGVRSNSNEADRSKSNDVEGINCNDADRSNSIEADKSNTYDVEGSNSNDADRSISFDAEVCNSNDAKESRSNNSEGNNGYEAEENSNKEGNSKNEEGSNSNETETSLTTETEKETENAVDNLMIAHDKDKSTDDDICSSDNEHDIDKDNDEKKNGRKDVHEQVTNRNKERVNERSVKETDIDTGQTVHISEMKRKKKKKKKKKKKEEATLDTGNTMQNNGVTTRSMTRNTEEEWSVKFHVLTSEQFHFDPDKYQVFIVMGNKEMGGWTEQNKQMKVERHIDGNIYELVYEATIPFRLIDVKNHFPYKYYFKKKGKEGKYEYYTRGAKAGVGVNRTLDVTHRHKSFGEWHQYDGFAEREPDIVSMGKMKEMFSMKGDFIKHAKRSIKEFCPQVSDFDMIGTSDYLMRIQMLFESLKTIYFQDARCWNLDYKAFMDFVGKNLMETMIKQWRIDNDQANTSKEEREQILMGCFLVLLTQDILKISIQDSKILQTLCRALLIRRRNNEKQCQDYLFMEKNFKERRQSILEVLLSLVKSLAGKTKDPSWLYIMTWVHFLSGVSSPFETQVIDLSHDSEEPLWWGITVKEEVEYFKAKSGQWAIPFETILDNLEPLFEIDYLLPRSFMAAVGLDDLEKVIKTGKIPVEICLATVTFYAKINQPDVHYDIWGRYYFLATSIEEMKVGKCMQSLLNHLQAVLYSETCTATQWTMCYIIAASLFEECTQADRSEFFLFSVQTLLHCLAMFDRCMMEKDEIVISQVQSPENVMKFASLKALTWMETWQYGWENYMENILMVWNSLLAPDQLQSGRVKDEWNKIISEHLSQILSEQVCSDSNLTKNLVELYCKRVDKFKPKMQDCMSKAAFQAISKGYCVNYNCFSTSENLRYGSLLSNMFMTEWKRHVKTQELEKEKTILQHVLTWAPFCHFLNIYFSDKKDVRILTKECILNLENAMAVIEDRVFKLHKGLITIGDLDLLVSEEETFLELTQIVVSETAFESSVVSKVIQLRKKEVKTFQKQAEEMSILATLCQYLPNVDKRCFTDVLKKQKDINVHSVNEFCLPADEASIEDINEYSPKLCAFDSPPTVLDMVPQLHAYNKSRTFLNLWHDKCKEVENECVSLEDVVQKVWTPVRQRWDEMSRTIQCGEIKFKEFEKYIGMFYKENYEKMEEELINMNVTEIKIRLDQLKKYRQLSTCVKGAKTLIEFATEFNLNGDFEQIKVIATQSDENLEMRSFDDSVIEVYAFLSGLTSAREKCLKIFVECEPLVKWLKTSMEKEGLKELKVFVDLALMSAGEEGMNIAKVQCLHAAVTGYAPLIFDLQTSSGYEDLLKHCAIVWKELDANPNLPTQLKDTNNNLQWFKEIKEAHGSVEVTSLMQVEAINEKGVFTVGKNVWKNVSQAQQSLGSLLLISDILRLTVLDLEEQNLERNYTFHQLQDLHSRLMLVAGQAEKGNDNVERFTMIFDSTIRLCNVYIKLCSSGCVLFKNWSAKFFFDQNQRRPVCIQLKFGQGEDAPQLKGRKSYYEDLKDMIPVLANFMETCYTDWLKHIQDKRKNHLLLNHFTVDQLVILQRELVKVGTETQPDILIYTLLSAVKANCTPDDILIAMADAKNEIEGYDEMTPDGSEGNMESDEDPEKLPNTTDDEKKQNFITELISAGYDEGLAHQALAFIDPEDVTSGIFWCMDHDDEITTPDDTEQPPVESQPMREQVTLRPTFSGWSQSQTDIQTMITSNIAQMREKNEFGSAPLIRDLTALWQQFLDSISSNMHDYLSLEHLGLILKHLARKDTNIISRSLPLGFREGEPNLIICPSGDVLMTTLSVYMMDTDQPLPQSDEILMCTSNTTKDEVDIFWRRAIFDGGRKIHCLVNADMLDYDVSEAAERCLEEYLHNKEMKYRLLVICGSDNEYRSTIVSSLDKFKRQPLPANTSHLQDYLANKLTIQEHGMEHGVRPAACVDSKRSTVRVIKSWRAGVGKTLFKQRSEEKLQHLNRGLVKYDSISIPLQEKTIDLHYVIERLLEHTAKPGEVTARLFHIDVAHEVENGVDYLLFNLLVLGCLMDKTGFVWRKSPTDIYMIETMPLMMHAANRRGTDLQYVHQMLNVLPDLTCRSPLESLQIYRGVKPHDHKETDQLFDEQQFKGPVFQRTFQYLLRLDQGRELDDIKPNNVEEEPQACLQTLLRHCGLEDPSWSELHHFVWFLNTQLVDFENNMFVSAAAAEDLPGFSRFVLRFLIQMSRDFSTRSLRMSEESPGVKPKAHLREERMDDGEGEGNDDIGNDLEAYQMRRTWESSPHPYLFFNSDRNTFTFLGFFIDKASGNLIDQQTGTVLENGIMAKDLYESLVRNHAPIQENFDALQRDQKITKLCNVMGIESPHDPDDTYELTTDNVKKIMAIYMRFRCDIPVIIMGETGCGKTRLVRFMCSLQQPPGVDMTNMILMKVHGGTTNKDIIRKVKEAEEIAQRNKDEYGNHIYTVLFFDEANTTEAIGLIKEIMCDKSMEGKKLKLCENLKMVAACNPYRRHSEELIKKLEQAGLGYHVNADETTDRLGRVPMRRLVYRVQPLPQSLLPLVWDFGQLNTQVEDLYIRQMVRRYIREKRLPGKRGLIEVISAILTASQEYMRTQKDECSFVSLRDVDRVLTVMSWFYRQSRRERTLYELMDEKLYGEEEDTSDDEDEDDSFEDYRVDDVTRSLILALGVCYHACLKSRPEYRAHIAQKFQAPCHLQNGADQIQEEIECCQEVFLDHVHLEKNIARNMALRENVFMMVVCIELRIPLFLVGKPGSSKSLAKTIVSDAMQGNAAREELFRELKQAQMVSFQCSPLATPDGIVGTFRQCAQFQKDKDLGTFVSIVVLDEVGLAEDSPRMPLKTLHPLLEDGCQGDEEPEKYKKVAFIGISNWALDPAKMNRGILVQREVPDLEELVESANGICKTEDRLGNLIEPLIQPLACSYLEIFQQASLRMREFYGLRDFYSLVKMVYGFVEKSNQPPTWHEMLHSIKRNFGGLDQVDPVNSFKDHLGDLVHIEQKPKHSDPDCTPAGLVQACLFGIKNMKSESRYLLLLTENYGTLTIIQQQILSKRGDIRPITIFGSSFRSDQEYTQVCRNINKIKVCMETGNTVVLLNLENLYESLYDALNQYYVYFGGERYVDLGLGTHRVKCPVHKNFRLIVVAEKQTVYEKFPIPLINRLEKHFLTINTMLTQEQQQVVEKLENWAKQFVEQSNFVHAYRGKTAATKVDDVFIGYHDDTCSAIILDVWDKHAVIEDEKDRHTQVLQHSKAVLLWCATPESLVRLEYSSLSNQEKEMLIFWYNKKQSHENLLQYLNVRIEHQQNRQLFAQITTHSKLVASVHKKEISKATDIRFDKILLLETLSSFDTEQQFSNRIKKHIQSTGKDPSLIVIQCDSGDVNANLIACARYCVMDELEKMRKELQAIVHVVFIIQLPRGASFTGFQCGLWHSVHIDDLYTDDMNIPSLQDLKGKSVSKLITDYVNDYSETNFDVDLSSKTLTEEKEMELTKTGWYAVRQQLDENYLKTSDLDFENKMEDVPLHLNDNSRNEDKHGGEGINTGYGQYRLNVKGLILSCVQAALSMVKDKVENTNKETDRVGLVLKLLHQEQVEGQASFLHGVCCLVAKLLKEKELCTHGVDMAHYWLINEAASKESIHKAGTFRHSCLMTLEQKIVPILAGIIAYLDTNNNLNILQDEDLKWKKELWLTFLNTTEAISIQYTDLQSPKIQSDLQEVVVMTTGCEGHQFSARMPFSWLLINQINEILKLPHPVEEAHQHDGVDEARAKTESSVNVLSEHAVGKVLSCISEEHDVTEAVQEYIYDFVQTMYKAASVHEQLLVCQSVTYLTTQMVNNPTENSLLHSLVNVHIAYQKLAPRLTYFRAMNSVWPECSSTIVDLKAKNPDHFMFKEQEYTFSALCLLLENLSPKGTDLNNLCERSHWLSRVHRYRPVVEKVIRLHGEDPILYGAQSIQSVRRAKCLWCRVLVMKLFLEHVCASESEDKITIKHCMPLWIMLGEEANMKEMKSVSGVEKFLKMCNKQALKEYMGSELECCECESVLEGPPITLPCQHVLCNQCFALMRVHQVNKCALCNQHIPENYQVEKRYDIEKLKDYQKRCNTFFMEVVSQLCFADNTAPSQEVVEKLLTYIFFTTKGGDPQRTRDLSIFNTGIDPTPVFRSFLLQLLMRTSADNMKINLEHYLTQAQILIKQNSHDDEQQYVELCLLVIQCLEDTFSQEASRTDELQYACEALQQANQNITTNDSNVEKLYGLASARMGLVVTARCVAEIVTTDVEPKHIDRRVRKLIEAAQILCEESNFNWTRIYLVKHLCRCYGIDVYYKVCQSTSSLLGWISMRDTSNRDQVVEVSDRYIVCGDHYTTIREAITKVILEENVQHLFETVQELQGAGVRTEPLLQLAIHREVTSSYLYPHKQQKLRATVMEILDTFIQECETVKNKTHMQVLVTNQLLPRHLVTVEGEDLRLQGIQCLLVHYQSVMMYLKGDRTLLQPLQSLMRIPQTCTEMLLPTMPQDDLEDIKNALLEAEKDNENENPVVYRCPNGHPYVIGDCGEPYYVYKCKCGADIGGHGHVLLDKNTKDAGIDRTLTGHILGQAQDRGQDIKPERTLTLIYTAIIRLILHMSMYIGLGKDLQGVQSLIKPDIDINGVEEFVWAHILQDIDDIHRTLGRSVDDVFLLMHTIIDVIFREHDEGKYVGNEVAQLMSKNGRNEWEICFCANFLQKCLQNIENTLKENNQLLVQDHRLGVDPLLYILYEIDTNVERENPAILEDIPRVWRYRTPISLQHLRQEVEAKVSQNQHKVLQLFLKEDHHLRALRYIPSILRLHRALFQKYQRKLDKAEASQIAVAQLKRDEITGVETNDLLQDFADAWELVRESLTLYLCPTELGGMIVSKEYCSKSITDNTPISILLPTIKEAGLCSYVLLDFLMRKQNDFLDKYLKEAQSKSSSISSVNPKEVTSAHLISYDPQHDILPLVLANCQYSFEMGKGTKIEYDFAALERQLMDRFLFSKSRIDVGRVLMIDQMVYRTEFTNAEVFRQLSEKINQERIGAVIKTQISGEIKSLPDICTSLDNLDITISFLKSTGGHPDKTLHEFMRKTLQMKTTIHSQKAQQACELRHAQSLWLLLSLQKSKKMIDNNQHTESTFESVSKEFHEELPDELMTEYKGYMKKLSVEKLSQLVEILHEYILLVVAVRQNPEDEDFTDTTNCRLGEWLSAYIGGMDTPVLDAAVMGDYPRGILNKHSVHTWICSYTILMERQAMYSNTVV